MKVSKRQVGFMGLAAVVAALGLAERGNRAANGEVAPSAAAAKSYATGGSSAIAPRAGGEAQASSPAEAPVPGHELRLEASVESGSMSTAKYQDYYREASTGELIEVVGSMRLEHRSAKGSFVSDKIARWSRSFGAPIARERALQLAAREAGHPAGEAEGVRLKVLPNPERTDARLVYWVDFEDRLVVVDAESSELVYSVSKHRAFAAEPKISVHSAKDQGVRTKKYGEDVDTDQLPRSMRDACQVITEKKGSEGTPIWINPSACTATAENGEVLPGADDDSARALEDSKIVARYYAEKHDRSSYDNQGSELVSVVHVGDGFDNAYWDEDHSYMAFGDGDGSSTGSYTKALDIVGHEMTHGVTAATAKLIGSGEPGALNESYSDFFGVMISNMTDPDPDWTIGKAIAPGHGPEDAGMRSMAQPGRFKTSVYVDRRMTQQQDVPYPSKVSEKLAVGQKCTDKNDQCEVHGNSTIPSHAAYLVAKALEDASAAPSGRYDRAAKLYYAVLTQWLTANDGFATAAHDTVEACKLMYDADTCAKVRHAFELTEMLR